MSKAIQFWSKFFYATGISLKVSFVRSSLWIFSSASICVYIASIIMACVFCDYSNIFASNRHVGIFLASLYWGTCFGASLVIFLVFAKLKVERKFWETVKEVERIFDVELGEDFDCGNFRREFGIKVFTSLAGFLLAEIPVIFYLYKKEYFVLLRNSIHLFIPKIILRLFMIKTIFYVEALNVCLRNIESKLKKKQFLRLGDLKVLRKVYNLCGELNKLFEDIFGGANVYLMLLLLVASIFYGNNICVNYAKGNFNFALLIPLFVNILDIFTSATTCEECVSTSKAILHLIFSINMPTFHEDVEKFVLLMQHQKIKFEPKSFFAVNHELVVGVSMDFDE